MLWSLILREVSGRKLDLIYVWEKQKDQKYKIQYFKIKIGEKKLWVNVNIFSKPVFDKTNFVFYFLFCDSMINNRIYFKQVFKLLFSSNSNNL